MSQFVYKGKLDEVPLPEMLYTINYYRVPGVITAMDGDKQKRIFIKDGSVIFATSNDVNERLGEYLLSHMKITQEQYDKSVELLKGGDKRQGTILVEMGAISPQELFTEVKNQITDIVWSLFNWKQGEVTFEVGNFKEDELIKIQLDTFKVILAGIKGMDNPKRLVKFIGHRDSVLEPTDKALTLLRQLPLGNEDMKVFRSVDGKMSLYELCTSSKGKQTEVIRILYALMVLRVIQKRDQTIKIVKTTKKPAGTE